MTQAPAAMPSEEEIQFVLAQPLKHDDWIVEKARAVLALFAPVVAENASLRETLRSNGVWDFPRDIQNLTLKLDAAEAAIAAAEERVRMALENARVSKPDRISDCDEDAYYTGADDMYEARGSKMKRSDIPPEITVEQIAGVIKASRKRREMLFIACACVGPAGYCACEQQYDREDAQAVMDFLEKAKGADSFGLTDVRDSGE